MKQDISSIGNLSPRDRGFLLGALLLNIEPYELPEHLHASELAASLERINQANDRGAILEALRLRMVNLFPSVLARIAPERLAERLRGETLRTARIAFGYLPECLQDSLRRLLPTLSALSPPSESGWNTGREVAVAVFLPCLAHVDLDESIHALSPETVWESVCQTGAQLLGRSLIDAEASVRARAMAAVGARWAGSIKREATQSADHTLRKEAQTIAALVGVALNGRDARSAEDRLAAMGYLSLIRKLSPRERTAMRMALPPWIDGLEKV
ncbi:MAG: hypothetical protein SGI86_20660 [Deltaproteobacteria bacterium]|nr:hypothetical protein [Deltaproteobacteria bacterium]